MANRRRVKNFILVMAFSLLVLLAFFRMDSRSGRKDLINGTSVTERINIGMVICGSNILVNEALVTMKSAILFRDKEQVHFLIVSQDHLREEILPKLKSMQLEFGNTFTYELHNVSFPETNSTFWQFTFSECSTQRLFFPDMFPHIEKILYVDLDTIFLNSLTDIWHYSHELNESQLVAIGTEKPGNYTQDSPERCRLHPVNENYNHSKYPLTITRMINSGILIMDLKKMRQFRWVPLVLKMFQVYNHIFHLTDQNILQLIFLLHPDTVHYLPCNYNFHKTSCNGYPECCSVTATHGVYFFHGSGDGYKRFKTFTALRQAFREYQVEISPRRHLIELLKKNVEAVGSRSCRSVENTVFLKHIHKLLPKN